MIWTFDQPANVACIASREIMAGSPVLAVVHYEDDHSWAFSGESGNDPAEAMVVAMSEVVALHPELIAIANLPPGWVATRLTTAEGWRRGQEAL